MRKHIFSTICTAGIAGLFWLGVAYPDIGAEAVAALFLFGCAALVYGIFYFIWNDR